MRFEREKMLSGDLYNPLAPELVQARNRTRDLCQALNATREEQIDFNCVVLDVASVHVGDYTLFGPAVQIYTASHPLEAGLRRRQEYAKSITIGSDVWVGGGAIGCPGVQIGSRSVVRAGSVVTRDIPEDVFAAGNPCRVIRKISEGEASSGNARVGQVVPDPEER